MKSSFLSLLSLLMLVSLALGDEAYDTQTIQTLKSPTFSKEEMKQMLFSASFLENYSPGTIGYALYNPSRDKIIRGIVINISGKEANTGQERSVDLFVDLDCGPLQCISNQETCTVLASLAKSTPVLTLKEAHYTQPVEDKPPVSAEAPTPMAKPSSAVVVRIRAGGVVEMNGAEIPSVDLPDKLKELADLPEKAAIMIKADKEVPYDQVTKVLELFRDAGITHVSFAVIAPAQSEK